MRTEGELRRNALGRGLVVKNKCDLVLIHACWEVCALLTKNPEKTERPKKIRYLQLPRFLAQVPSPMITRMPSSSASEASSACSLLSRTLHHATRKTTKDVFVARGVSRKRLLRETHPRCKFLLLRSRPLAALALTAPLGSLAQGFRAFRAQEILLCWREISQNWQRFVLAGFSRHLLLRLAIVAFEFVVEASVLRLRLRLRLREVY